jgi:5-methylthioadenosine/S-adenosylhomocysteine deaminase
VSPEIRIVGATAIVASPTRVLWHAEIALSPSTGVITYLGPGRGPLGPGDISAVGRIVAPGLINGHTHAGISLLRGHSDDAPLREWLTHIRAFEVLMTRDDIRAGLLLSMAEMIRTGTVGFLDMFLWDSGLLADVRSAGMRVQAAPAVFGYDAVAYPRASEQTGSQALDATPRLAAEFAGDELISVSYAVHAPYSCGPELMADVAGRSAGQGLGVQIHLAETRTEVADSLAAHGRSPIALAADLGLMAGRLHVAHAVHPEPGDTELLAAADGVTVSHNPISNLKLGAGIAPVPSYLRAGVTLALGTDSMASNNSADRFEEIKMGALLPRGVHHDPALVSGVDTLTMATSGGARALGGGLSGTLAAGRAADLILVDTGGPTGTPMTNPVAFLSYAARGTDVTDVFVAGRRLLADRLLTTLDEHAIRADADERVTRIRAELTTGPLNLVRDRSSVDPECISTPDPKTKDL